MIVFESLEDFNSRKAAFERIIRQWIRYVLSATPASYRFEYNSRSRKYNLIFQIGNFGRSERSLL
jgi:hypothetical protein